VGMPQPVRRDLADDPRARRSLLDNALHGGRVEVTAAAGTEHGCLSWATAEAFELVPHGGWEKHYAGLAALAEDRHLAGIVPRLEIAPPGVGDGARCHQPQSS